jgi:hypothetical protein
MRIHRNSQTLTTRVSYRSRESQMRTEFWMRWLAASHTVLLQGKPHQHTHTHTHTTHTQPHTLTQTRGYRPQSRPHPRQHRAQTCTIAFARGSQGSSGSGAPHPHQLQVDGGCYTATPHHPQTPTSPGGLGSLTLPGTPLCPSFSNSEIQTPQGAAGGQAGDGRPSWARPQPKRTWFSAQTSTTGASTKKAHSQVGAGHTATTALKNARTQAVDSVCPSLALPSGPTPRSRTHHHPYASPPRAWSAAAKSRTCQPQ